jgi:hypothetical protein
MPCYDGGERKVDAGTLLFADVTALRVPSWFMGAD